MIEPILEIITVGREILDGRVLDTNSVVIAEELRTLGLTPRFAQKVDDHRGRIRDAFKIASERSNLVLVTGGLGPTSDDITAEVFAEFLGVKTVLNPEALSQIETIFKQMNRPMLEVQRKQALLPEGVVVLKNPNGTAPGFGWINSKQNWFFMPGVPREMKPMLHNEVLPKITLRPKGTPRSKTWATQFTSEGKLQTDLNSIEKKLPANFEFTYRTKFPENHIGLYALLQNDSEKSLFKTLCQEIETTLGDTVFSITEDEKPLSTLEEIVVQKLKTKQMVIASVESCTGGLIATRLTNVSGSSQVFWGSFVTYDNSAKSSAVGVSESLLEKCGAVSKEVAESLSLNGLKKMMEAVEKNYSCFDPKPKQFICVSTTGIAGPSGGTEEKPVGLCYIGISYFDGKTIHTSHDELKGRHGLSRELYRVLFSQKALELVRGIV